MGLPSVSSCLHVLEATGLLQTRVPGQGPASSWGLDLGAPLLSISHSRATPLQGLGLRSLQHLRGSVASHRCGGDQEQAPLPSSLQNVRTARGGWPWVLLFHPRFTSPHQVCLGPVGCARPCPVSRGFWQASPEAPREPQMASDPRSVLGHGRCRRRGPVHMAGTVERHLHILA